MNTAETGKIARLPKSIRDELGLIHPPEIKPHNTPDPLETADSKA
jgi:hypothetical protein